MLRELPSSGWVRACYSYKAITCYSVQTGYFLNSAKVKSKTFAIDSPGYDALPILRAEMAKLHDNGHAWYTATFTLTPDGKFKFKFDFDYDHLPTFDIMPDPEDWLDEFKHYPRPELQAQIQDWIDGRVPYEEWRSMVARLKQLASQ